MTNQNALPPFTVVRTEDASHAAARRLRVHVAISPEDTGKLSQVALEVIDTHAADNDVVLVFFHPSETAANRGDSIAMARAQYIRNDLRRDFRPRPLTGSRTMVEVETTDGVITVERPEMTS